MDTIYIFILLILEIVKKQEKIFIIRLQKASLILVLFFFYLFVNVVISSLMGPKGFSLSGLVVYIRLLQYVPIFIILSNSDINLKQSVSVINTFIWTGISGSILAIYQLYSGMYFYMKGMPSFTMPVFREANISTEVGFYAGSGNYNVFAAFLLIPILLNIIVWNSLKEVTTFRKGFFIISTSIMIAGLYVANSRAALLGTIIGIISMNINTKMIWSTLKTFFTIAIIIIIAGYIFQNSPFVQNITDIFLDFKKALPYAMENATYNSNMGFSGDTLGAVVRIFGYLEAIRVFLVYPIFGCGFDLFLTQATHYPENLFLQILAETGIIGFCIFTIFIYKIYTNMSSLPILNKFNKYYTITLQGIIIALVFVNMTGATLLIQKVWGPFMLLSGFYYGYQHSMIKLIGNNNEK